MQINNHSFSHIRTNPEEIQTELKQGDVYRASIKQRVSETEAIIQIRGRELPVNFEGKVPVEDRVTVQVKGDNSQQVQVRVISTETKNVSNSETSPISHTLRSLGIDNASPQLRQAAQMVLEKGIPLRQESVQEMRVFLEKEKGTMEQKLNAIQAVANKSLDITATHLRAVNEALHGRPLNQVLTDIVKSIDPKFEITNNLNERGNVGGKENRQAQQQVSRVSEEIRQVREQVQREPNVARAIEQVRTEVASNPRVEREVAREVERAVTEARVLQQNDRETQARDRLVQALQTAERELARTEVRASEPNVMENRPAQVSEEVRQVREQVQREPNVARAIEQVRTEVASNPRVEREVAREVERAVTEARVLQQNGRGTQARDRLVQALQAAERELARTEVRASEPRVVESRPIQEQPPRVSEEVRQVREQVQREPNVARAIEQVRTEVASNPRVEREVAREVERAVTEARVFHQNGRETQARDRRVQALQTAERELARTEVRASEPRVVESRPIQEQPPRVSEEVRQVREQVQREPNVARAIEQVRTEVANNPRVEREVAREVERAVTEVRGPEPNVVEKRPSEKPASPVSEQVQKPTDVLAKMQQLVQREGNFQKVVDQVNDIIKSSTLDRETLGKIEQTLQQATETKQQGKELAARQQMMQSFTELEQQTAKLEQTQQLETKQYEINELFQTQQLTSKDLIVQTITEKLAKAQNDFKQLQRDITRNLDNASRLIDQFKTQANQQVKPLLESTIKKLDNAILKSELMLLTDMKTEKNLMRASSDLQEAKKLLSKGNYQEASRIVKDVKKTVENLIFKPTETKIKHFIMKEQQQSESRTPSQQLLQQFDDMARASALKEGSARQTFEMVRNIGLNRDSELGQMLANGGHSDEGKDQNMKSALMKLLQTEEAQGSNTQATREALANITGQQLLSKSDTNSNLQSIFFNLPFLLQDKVENLQVFVNSRNDGQQVDWENCQLYFLIETKKLGDVGILVTSTDRNLSLTIKNDKPLFKERMEPLAELCKEHLQEIGYHIAQLQFTKLTNDSDEQEKTKSEEQSERFMPVFTEKGYDFKI